MPAPSAPKWGLLAAFCVSFVTAVASVSCGAGDQSVTCSAATCDGCCEQGVCRAITGQDATRCGTGGAACGTCSRGQVCGATGCAAGTCGALGGACCAGASPCQGSATCQGGICVSPGGGTLATGTACTADTQCLGGRCAIPRFPDGYCTADCASGSCAGGSTCGRDPGDSTGTTRICLDSCAAPGTASDCRTGYVCDSRLSFDGSGACIAKCNSPATCAPASQCDTRGLCCGAEGFACCNGTTCDGTLSCVDGYCRSGAGTGPVGAACNDGASQCSTGYCQVEIPTSTNANDYCESTPCWPSGYCTRTCDTNVCPQGSACSGFFTPKLCLDLCTYDGGQGGCRTGYVCDRGWTEDTVNNPAVCVTACKAANDCDPGAQCDGRGFCCGLKGLACCGGAGGTCSTGTCNAQGYCQ